MPFRIELSEMVGGESDQAPYPLHQPSDTNVTVSLAPTFTQVEAELADSLYATFPEAQFDRRGGVVEAADGPEEDGEGYVAEGADVGVVLFDDAP
jgi:hypothetical protein